MKEVSSTDPQAQGKLRQWGLALLEHLENAEEQLGRHLQADAESLGVANVQDAKAWLYRQSPQHLARLFQQEYPELPLERMAALESRRVATRLLTIYANRGTSESQELPGVQPPHNLQGESRIDT